MNTGLAIPSLRRVAPRMLVTYPSTMSARFALDMLDLRLLDDTMARGRKTNTQILQAGMERWWARTLGDLQVLPRISIYLHEDSEGYPGPGAVGDAMVHLNPKRGARMPTFTLKRRISAIERSHPGLGAYALRSLHRAQTATAQVINPILTLYFACDAYWMGEHDETYYLEEAGEDEGILTRAEFDRAIPAWATDTHGWKRWTPRAPIRGHALQVLECCNDIHRLTRHKHTLFLERIDDRRWYGGPWVEIAAIARWSEDDVTLRVVDDWMNMAQQDSYHDTFGSFLLKASDNVFGPWLTAMPTWCETYRALDRLLVLVGDQHG